jgi:ABC-type antimicrobial peptide transport system permease subunit
MYGVVAYAVTRRRREIGIRMALGAARRSVIVLMVRQVTGPVIAGGLLGLVAAAPAPTLLRDLLYGGTRYDPVAFVAVPVLLVAVAILAACLPARAALRTDPIKALRYE